VQVLIINQFEVQRLLPMAECMDVMAETLAALGRGQAANPLRQTLWLPEEIGVLASMPASLGNEQTLGLKVHHRLP
jgi:ornithine cyclodeaminase/alanine dehydrogenase-like protein (mu-crystallin family)